MTIEKVKDLLIDLDIDEIAGAVQGTLDEGESAKAVLDGLCGAMLEVGRLYEEKEYYLPELVLAGETMDEAMAILNPLLADSDIEKKGKVVAATVKGDLHDIGKNIVVTMLTSAGYEIVDLGKDVDSKEIADKAKEVNADIIAVSALLTMTVVEIETIVAQLKENGYRDKVTIICGGAPLNQELAEKLGADISCDDAIEGIGVCDKIMADKK